MRQRSLWGRVRIHESNPHRMRCLGYRIATVPVEFYRFNRPAGRLYRKIWSSA